MHPSPLRKTALAVATVGMAVAGALAPAMPASAVGVAMTVAVAADGHGPFTPADEPGGDVDDHNGIIRTNDSIVYEVDVNSAGGTASHERFTLTAPDDTAWSRLPSDCIPAESTISRRVLTCGLGDLTNATKKVSVVLGVTNTAVNGRSLVPTGAVFADGVDETAGVLPAAVRVSAAPRFDLSINTVTPGFTAATGTDGVTPGHRITYPILLDWKGIVAGDGLLGYERLAGDVSFTDDVSKMFGRKDSPATLLPFGSQPACGVNTGQIPGAPGGRGGGADNVVDSGRISCTQAGPGQPVSVSITGVDSSLSSIPTNSVSGGALAGGKKAYVVSGYLSLWIPEPESIETLTAVNTYRDLVSPSVSSQVDYGAEGEPLGNNSASRNVGTWLGVTGSERYWGIDPRDGSTIDLSGKNDLPYITPGQNLRASAGVANRGTEIWNASIVCSVFDNRVQHLSDKGSGSFASSSSPRVTGAPQFAAFTSSNPDALRDATCGDSDAQWFDDPADVPGGPEAVGMVRWNVDFPAAVSLQFHTFLKADERLPNYTRFRSFTSILPGDTRAWVHDSSTGAEANGSWADFLTSTADLARLTSKVVDEGFDAVTTPDKTQYIEQGKTATFALYPTLTNATSGGDPDTVTVRDVLPLGTTLVPGSASPSPNSVTDETDSEGNVRQVLSWTFPDHVPNAPLPILTFAVKAGQAATAGTITNSAIVSSSRDISPQTVRQTDRALHVLAVGAVDVVESAERSGVVLGDDLKYVLRYTNNADSAFDSTDLISVLPFVGDDRQTSTRTILDEPVAVGGSETVHYTSRDPEAIDLDGADPSNGPTGATKWCPESAFGSSRCPAALASATGIRIVRTDAVPVGTSVEHTLEISSLGAHDGDRAGSSFGLRVANLSLPVASNIATVDIHAGAIGHRVWFDANSDGLQSDSEPGLDEVRVDLAGSDDLGRPVERSTTTDHAGDYEFADLRPGDYRLAFGHAGGGWTTLHAGDDSAHDSDVDEHGDAETTLTADTEGPSVDRVSSELHVDAGALPDVDPVDPPVVVPPHQGGDGSSRPIASHPTAPAVLAFTGSTLGLWVLVGALLALLVGVVGVVVARRRQRGE